MPIIGMDFLLLKVLIDLDLYILQFYEGPPIHTTYPQYRPNGLISPIPVHDKLNITIAIGL